MLFGAELLDAIAPSFPPPSPSHLDPPSLMSSTSDLFMRSISGQDEGDRDHGHQEGEEKLDESGVGLASDKCAHFKHPCFQSAAAPR